jgi:hypothetical protein
MRGKFGFKVLMAVTVKITVFWHVMPCRPVEVHRSFGDIYCLYLQGRRISQVNYCLIFVCMAYSLALKMEAVHLSET